MRDGERDGEMPILEINGLLSHHFDGEGDDVLFVSSLSRPFARSFGAFDRKRITVRYWITEPGVSKEEAQQGFLSQALGIAATDYGHAYSELTGYLWTNEEAKVGGHDLVRELSSHLGKWLYMEVEYKGQEICLW